MAARIVGLIYRKRAGQYAPDGGVPGYIAGALPTGGVTSNGAAAAREIEVRARDSRAVIATTFSAPDGSFRIDDINAGSAAAPVLLDVIGRDWTGTYNDVIVSRCRAWPYAVTELTGSFTANNATHALEGAVRIFGGVPGYSVSVVSGTAPTGITFAIADEVVATHATGWKLVTASGTASAGTYSWTLRVTASNSAFADLACAATFS